MTNQTTNKPSFLLYKSFHEPIKNLTLEEKGLLFDAIFNYQNGVVIENLPIQVGMAFAFFKNQFDLDNIKYKETCNKNSDNVRLRWEKEKSIQTNTTEYDRIRPNTNHTDKDKDKDKEIDKEKEKELNNITIDSQFENFWQAYIPVKTKDGFIQKGSKQKAEIAFNKAIKKNPIDKILKSLESYLKYCSENQRFTKNVVTWLNDANFEEIETTFIISEKPTQINNSSNTFNNLMEKYDNE